MCSLNLGDFNISSNKIQICDPSYKLGDSGTLTINNALNGKYFASFEVEDNFIANLHICHQKYSNSILEFEKFGDIYFDSGQAGFFDFNFFVKNQGGTFDDVSSFYGTSCAITLSPKQAGIINNFGVISSSGFGDGRYDVFVAKNINEKIVAAFISFIELEVF